MNPSIQNSIPSHKSDVTAAESAVALGWPVVEPITMQLLEWLQDMNWPVARVLAPFFQSIGVDLAPYLRQVLQTRDEVWKYWVIQAVVAGSRPLTQALEPILRQILEHPTDSEHKEEVDVAARLALGFL